MMLVVDIMSLHITPWKDPWYPLNRKLGGPLVILHDLGDRKISYPSNDSNPIMSRLQSSHCASVLVKIHLVVLTAIYIIINQILQMNLEIICSSSMFLQCAQCNKTTGLFPYRKGKTNKLDFCLTLHYQLGKVIQMNQLVQQ